jgi:hypothetical protein
VVIFYLAVICDFILPKTNVSSNYCVPKSIFNKEQSLDSFRSSFSLQSLQAPSQSCKKRLISFVMSVCMSIRRQQSDPTERIFIKLDNGVFLENPLRNFKVLLKSDNNNRHFCYLFIRWQTNAILWFFAPTCFGTYMPSSRSLCVPSKQLAHLLLSWVKSAQWMEVDYCLLSICVAICWEMLPTAYRWLCSCAVPLYLCYPYRCATSELYQVYTVEHNTLIIVITHYTGDIFG